MTQTNKDPPRHIIYTTTSQEIYELHNLNQAIAPYIGIALFDKLEW